MSDHISGLGFWTAQEVEGFSARNFFGTEKFILAMAEAGIETQKALTGFEH